MATAAFPPAGNAQPVRLIDDSDACAACLSVEFTFRLGGSEPINYVDGPRDIIQRQNGAYLVVSAGRGDLLHFSPSGQWLGVFGTLPREPRGLNQVRHRIVLNEARGALQVTNCDGDGLIASLPLPVSIAEDLMLDGF